MKIFEVLKARNVTRLHCYPTHRPQNLADHQWGVAMWLLYIMQGRPMKHVHEAMLYAMLHDIGEVAVGDIPSPTKRLMPDKGQCIDDREKQHIERVYGPLPDIGEDTELVKVADLLDLMHYCLTERRMGNLTLTDVFDRADEYIDEIYTRRGVPNPWVVSATNDMRQDYCNA